MRKQQWLGWPKDNYMPTTLEEKVVCYADKRIDHDQITPIEDEIKQAPDEADLVKRQKELEGCMQR